MSPAMSVPIQADQLLEKDDKKQMTCRTVEMRGGLCGGVGLRGAAERLQGMPAPA
jgi:hypothetical protein